MGEEGEVVVQETKRGNMKKRGYGSFSAWYWGQGTAHVSTSQTNTADDVFFLRKSMLYTAEPVSTRTRLPFQDVYISNDLQISSVRYRVEILKENVSKREVSPPVV